jgi:16S rRNA (cytidine1402-2'-O)-methyltransferase
MSEESGTGMSGTALRSNGCGTLYVVATPIGNLSDLSERSIQILRSVSWVAAEDTRTSRVLLDRVGSAARTIAAHRHNENESAAGIVALLEKGSDVALVSDAGTPAVSDPGCRVVSAALSAGLRVVPIPGPSAAIAMVSASGLVEGPFHFEGFLPARARARDERLDHLSELPYPFVLFEAPHRIADTLPAIAARCGAERTIAIGRELTKKFEELHRCQAGQAADWLAADANRLRGEYVLVVAAPVADAGAEDEAQTQQRLDVRRLLGALLAELPLSRAVRVATQATGLPHREVYRLALELKEEDAP